MNLKKKSIRIMQLGFYVPVRQAIYKIGKLRNKTIMEKTKPSLLLV